MLVGTNGHAPAVSHFEDQVKGNLIAEIVSLKTSKSNEKIDMIFDNPNDIHSDRKVTLRSTGNQEVVTKAQAEMQFWFTPKKWYVKHDGKYYPLPLREDKDNITES